MEYEAWMLAIINNYIVSKGQKVDEIIGQIGVDITNDDLETSVYHPYPLAQKIYQACGEDYHKHGKESFSFLSTLTVSDYEQLRHSARCASFAKFIDSLLSAANPSLP